MIPVLTQPARHEGMCAQSPQVVALIPCRDGEKTVSRTVQSLLDQTVETAVVVADDASVDNTPQILRNFEIATSGKVRHVRYHRREPKDYGRVPALLNMALEAAPSAPHYMISGDDSLYPRHYVEEVVGFMEREGVDICSGYFGEHERILPSGSGRVISSSILRKIAPFPRSIGWESWMLYKAMAMGRKVAVYPVEFYHSRGYSLRSTLTFGFSAYLNGVPLIFTMARTLKTLVTGIHSPLNAISITFGHLEYMLRRPERFDIAPFVYDFHKKRIKKTINELLGL